MVNYVDTVNGYELAQPRRGLGEPFTLAALATMAPALAPVVGKGIETGLNVGGSALTNWFPAVTGATSANIFSKGVADLAAAEEAAEDARLVRFALGIGGALIAGLVIYKVVKS